MNPQYPKSLFFVITAQRSLHIAALFHLWKLIRFSPLADLGIHNWSHDTNAFLDASQLPVQRKVLQILASSWVTFFGNRNTWAQYVCTSNRTLLISCNLPLYYSSLVVQHLIFDIILSTTGIHCCMVSFLEDRGTPRYLKGSSPKVNCISFKICSFNSIETPVIHSPDYKIWHYFGSR